MTSVSPGWCRLIDKCIFSIQYCSECTDKIVKIKKYFKKYIKTTVLMAVIVNVSSPKLKLADTAANGQTWLQTSPSVC